MMRVVMDISPLVQHRGMGRYARELIRALRRSGVEVVGVSRTGRVLRGEYFRFFYEGRKHGLKVYPRSFLRWMGGQMGDVFHAVEPPLYRPYRLPRVLTLHDFALLRSGGVWEGVFRKIHDHPPERIIAVSWFTKREIDRYYPELSDRVRVVYHGVNPEIFFPESEKRVRDILNRLGLQWKKYYLFVGEADERKNLGVLAKMVQDPELPPLVVVGASREKVERSFGTFPSRLRFWEPQPIHVIRALYRGSIALFFPSREEGFGFPVLEAMACGTLVITTPCTALPEVGGDVALYLPPDDPEAWRAMAHELAKDRGESHVERIRRGLERVKKFTWKRTARETLKVYREALEEGR